MSLMDLFRPRWKNSNWEVRVGAVERITDPEVLIEVINTDPIINVRLAALEEQERHQTA